MPLLSPAVIVFRTLLKSSSAASNALATKSGAIGALLKFGRIRDVSAMLMTTFYLELLGRGLTTVTILHRMP
jgi:hypothetical protein